MAIYKIVIKWRGNKVLEGECSAVMVWENIRYIASNFGNAEKAGFVVPTLVDMVNPTQGQVFEGHGKDDTGEASYRAVCLYAN